MNLRKLIIIAALFLFFVPAKTVSAQMDFYGFPPVDKPPIFCGNRESLSCPNEVMPIYEQIGETCASSYADFLTDPKTKHFWVEDPAITAQGKADERARQFLYWVLNTSAIDNARVLTDIWQYTAMLALFGVVLVAAVFGIGYIISQRTNYDFKIRIWPTIIKIGTMLLYVAFSASIVFFLIQFSEVLMKFSYENLGGQKLFNIYFAADDNLLGRTEASYTTFVGCRDLNIRVTEGINAEIFMLKLTNVSYYVMGSMLLLRKILLWFLLFVSPFLALLMPFIFIRNTGWIWIGVFFQWLFYGPLLTLFLGAMAKIWEYGIPFSFDFSRVEKIGGYIYPTGINIVYGGPAQRIYGAASEIPSRPISAMNNGSYVDTFAEYVITLIMLWAVTFFPWWLLRIFRDYCCDGIYAMKNILLAMYDNMRGGPPKGPTPSGPTGPTMKLDRNIPIETDIKVSLGSLAQMKKSMTLDLAKNLNLSASRITDIARVETNKQMQSVVNQNLTFLANPVKAQRPAERQQYMNLRSELFARAIKNDSMARTILASTSTSVSEKTKIRESIIKSMPQTITISQVVTEETHVPKEKVTNITNTYTKNITNNTKAIESIARSTNTPPQIVNNILNSYNKTTNSPVSKVVNNIAKENNTSVSTVKQVLQQAGTISSQAHMLRQIATVEKLDSKQITKVLTSIRSSVTREESTIQAVSAGTQLPPVQVEQLVQQSFTAAVSNEQVIEQIAPPTGQPTVIVKAVVQSFVKNMSMPATRLVEKISDETKVERNTVSKILNQTSKVMENSTLVKEVAEKNNVTTHDVQTVIEKAVEISTIQTNQPAIAGVVKAASSQTTVTSKTIQNVINEIANNPTTIKSVATQTNMQEHEVSSVIKSYASNLNQTSQNITQKIAQETQINEGQVQNILQNVSQTVTNSKAEQTTIAKSANVQKETVQKITQSIGKTVEISKDKSQPTVQHIATTSSSESNTIQQILETFSQNTNLTTQVAEETNMEQQTVSQVLQSFSTHLNESSNTIIKSVASDTKVSEEHVNSIIQSAATAVTNSNTYQEQITQITNAPAETIKQVAQSVTTITQKADTTPVADTIITDTATSTALTEGDVTNVIQTFATNEELINQVAQTTQIDAATVKNAYASYTQHLTEAPTELVKSVASETNLTQEQVQNIMQSSSEILTNAPQTVTQIAQTTNMSESNVQKIANAMPQSVTTTAGPETSIVKQVSQQSNISETESQKIIHNLMMTAIQNETFVENLANQTQLKTQQVKNIMSTYANNINQPSEKIVQTINESSGIPKASVQTVLITLADSVISSDQIVAQVAEQEGMEPQQVSEVMQKQMEVASEPEKHIEKTISIPQSISLEDYEEVKDMWTKHYEEGEVPVTDTIQTRKDWVDQEIVYITNTLNKILSPDERIQQEGLDELGYLLPIFLINNLKGEELIVYLKAKLEAAKLTQKILEREEAIKDQMKKDQGEEEEVLVDVAKKEEENKEMHMDLEDEEQAPKSIEDRVKAVQEKLESVDTPEPTGDQTADSINAIKSKLQEKSDK